MNEHQVQWARQHDWFVADHLTSAGYVVEARDDEGQTANMFFDDFKELKAWAGY